MSDKLKVLSVIGTRPEAIKMAPVIRALQKRTDRIESVVCNTAQHREMVDQVLEVFDLQPDIDLDIMQPGQTLPGLTSRVILGMTDVLQSVRPDWALVQGDTTTVFATGLAAFYEGVNVGHVEAGLRTYDKRNPFPEEINRRMAGVLATFHFAPTKRAALALSAEQVPEGSIIITGNTVVDALLMTVKRPVNLELDFSLDGRRMILVTAHRRESFGAPFESLCLALRDLAIRNSEVEIVYPVHLNPNVRDPVGRILASQPRIHLIEPLRYEKFSHLMAKAYLILTDSGGIQEEASYLKIPILTAREGTERPITVNEGTNVIIWNDLIKAKKYIEQIMTNKYKRGKDIEKWDGKTAERIVRIVKREIDH